MSFHEDELVNPMPFKEDFLIREIVLTHDPDGRWLDSELLLHLVESTFCSTTENVFEAQFVAIGTNNIDLTGSKKEPISLTIYKISNAILSQCFKDQNLHRKTLALLEMLTHYKWDAKVVLALASFARSFSLFWFILQLQSDNALAVLLATFKQLPKAVSVLKPKFKALNILINTMVKLTKLIISFEGMFLHHELVDEKAMDIAKSKIYVATYWIFRSILVCSSQVADLRKLRLEQYSDRTVIAAWELHSLGNKLNNLYHDLGECVKKCQLQIETRLYEKLQHMFKENQEDNQNGLSTLFASQNDPFKNPSSGEKCDILELKNKVVLILISKPEILPIDKVFFLVQQTSDHLKHTETEVNHAILWVPIQSSDEWTHSDKTNFEFFSSCLPWFCVRRPWLLNSTVIRYIKQEWNFEEDPIMVVLDQNGVVTNTNAIDMVWIWGPKAFPFSTSREKELWEEEYGMVDLMINGINPLLSMWVEEGSNLCLYGSNNIDWIREFDATINTIKSGSGIQLEVVYVGCKNPNESVKTIIDSIDQEKLSTSLTFSKVQFFWFRLESIKRSIRHQDHTTTSNKTTNKLSELIEFKDNENWAVFSKGSSNDVIKLDEDKLKECVELLPFWCKNVASIGLVGAIKSAFEAPFDGGKCPHVEEVPYDGEEGLSDKPLICGLCKRPMEKFILYKCDE